MMNWFNDIRPQMQNTALTMGNFDGMHLGHIKVLSELITQSEQMGITPVVLSYIEHPGHFVHFQHPVSILTPRIVKKQLFLEQGIEKVFFLNFTSESAHTSAERFFLDVMIPNFQPKLIVSGYDTHFGYQREGNADFLRKFEQEYHYRTVQIVPVYHQNTIISSSAIRKELTTGNLETANAMLGQPYRLYGTVTYGLKLGKTIGFPTINLNLLDIEQLIPKNGIYLSSVRIEGIKHFGLTNIGISPTLKNSAQIEIETHILDFDSDVYQQNIELDLLKLIRDEKSFASVEELKQAITRDIVLGRSLLKEYE